LAIAKTALVETIDRAANGRGTVGLAVIGGPGEALEAVWVPASASEAPAFLTYSITKTFTAALMLGLCDEGRVSLDDRLARWFPRVAGAERISLRQLLNHTAGVPDYGGLAQYHEAVRASPSSPWSFERFAAETFDKGLSFEPGSSWAYSNPGYMLLKRIAEEVAGASYTTMIRERIAEPLGLHRTFVPESPGDLSGLAPARSRARWRPTAVSARCAAAIIPDGSGTAWWPRRRPTSSDSSTRCFAARCCRGRRGTP
jgi:D-alanyl-D-alanine carboxypeptidase